jgi:hypothetical protein
MKLGSLMGIILGVSMRKECRMLTKSSFSIFLAGIVCYEPLNDTSHTEARSEKVWQLVVKNNLIGSLSDGFFGRGGLKLKKKITKNFAKNTHIKSLFFEIRKN